LRVADERSERVSNSPSACSVLMDVVAGVAKAVAPCRSPGLWKRGMSMHGQRYAGDLQATGTKKKEGSSIVSRCAERNSEQKRKKNNNNKIKYAPFARRRAQACRVSSRAVSNAPPHRRHAYAPAPTAWMCRWKVSARTPPRSESQPRRGQRISPSVREVWSIASVASSLCIHAYINIYAYGESGIRNFWAQRGKINVPPLRARP
jgi:hypothetical protein